MERSEIRVVAPHCASLHAGYEQHPEKKGPSRGPFVRKVEDSCRRPDLVGGERRLRTVIVKPRVPRPTSKMGVNLCARDLSSKIALKQHEWALTPITLRNQRKCHLGL